MKKAHAIRVAVWCSALLVFVFASVPRVQAQDSLMTLHLCLPSDSTCEPTPDPNFGVIITTNPLPTFGIVRSPNNNNYKIPVADPQLTLAVFVPSQEPLVSFTVSFGSASGSSSLVSATDPWMPTAGDPNLHLFSYLTANGIVLTQCDGCGPASPLDAFLGPASAISPLTAGFDVYLVDLGSVSFPTSNTFSLSGIGGFPKGTIFYAFVTDGNGTVVDTTAPSSSIMIVPEPGSIALFGTGLLVVGGVLRRRWRAKA